MKILAFDIETNGLLMHATKFHCGVAEDIDTGERHEFTDVDEMYSHLPTAKRIVAHNGRMFDIPVLECMADRSVRPDPLPPCLDTLLISRLLWPDKGNTPAGGHSLEKWATYLGLTKLHTGIEDWTTYTPEMLERCGSDVGAQVKLYHYLLPLLSGWGESVQLEHTVATIITKQIQNGFPIDMDRVEALERDLMYHRAGEMDKLGEIPDWIEQKELKTPAYWSVPAGSTILREEEMRFPTKGACPKLVQKYLVRGPNKIKTTLIPFNSASTDHVARLFKEKYGWKPTKLTETGKAVVSEDVLKTLDYPEAMTIARIKLIDKRLSQIAQWRKYERDGRIHGDVITNGCVSGRMSHSKPNMAQIPKGKTEKYLDEEGEEQVRLLWGEAGKWGADCRDCFTSRDGWTLVGADASGLELRMLAHYMARWDGGAYGREVLDGDIHTKNQIAAGLPDRDSAKTFIYAVAYGSGPALLGEIVGGGYKEGKKMKDKFLTSLPAFAKLTKFAQSGDTLKGLDGRTHPIRSPHMALNTLLQGAGAIVMKKSLCIFYEAAERLYGPHGGRWALCAAVHDEQQWECEKEIAQGMGKLFCEAITKAGEHFNMGVRLDGDYKVGSSWAETH